MAGALLVAYAAPRALGDRTVGWWYVPAAPAGRDASRTLLYAGMAVLCGAWIGLGSALPGPRALIWIAAAWALALALAPPLFSRDVYSYLAQGTIMHLGHSPYHSSPAVLSSLGRQHVLDAVSPFWRYTTAPYGPLFLGAMSVIVAITGSHLIAGVLLTRLLEAVGLALLAVHVPRLTRALGTDPRRALWLALLSPLVMLQLVAAGHNDVLMVGMLVAGVAYALSGRPLLGVAVCALAATIKVPALAGAVLIAVAWARAERTWPARARLLGAAGAVTIAVLGAVTLITGAGLSWISTAVLSTPAKVHLAITPVTQIGYTLSRLLDDVGIANVRHQIEDPVALIGVVLTAVAGLVAVARVRIATLVVTLGVFLVLAAALGPAAWPWYFTWGLALLAAVSGVQRSRALAAAIVVSVFVVKPGGTLALPVYWAPAMLAAYALAGAAIWWQVHRTTAR